MAPNFRATLKVIPMSLCQENHTQPDLIKLPTNKYHKIAHKK